LRLAGSGSFAQDVVFLLVAGVNSCRFARKEREIHSIQKSDLICSKALIEFVPTIFHYLHHAAFRSRRRARGGDLRLVEAPYL
jgi:hypothetical protein